MLDIDTRAADVQVRTADLQVREKEARDDGEFTFRFISALTVSDIVQRTSQTTCTG
jgi:hypothetical protein